MKGTAFTLGSAYISLLAFIIVCIDQLLKGFMPIGAENGFSYISFIAWAVYFFAGCTVKGGIKSFLSYICGIVASILIIMLAGLFSSFGFFAVPVAIILIVFPILYLEKIPYLDLIPALFVGSGTFFGMMNYVPDATFCTAFCVEMIYATIGLLFGWITIMGKSYIEKKCSKCS